MDTDSGDLPPELIAQLSSDYQQAGLHSRLRAIARDADGSLTIDEFLIHLYRRYKTVEQRADVSKSLCRLSATGHLRRARCGTYETGEIP